MISIQKQWEPQFLTQYKQQLKADYDSLDKCEKDKLKKILLEEQGYLCCYCMGRINQTNMKIEHWHAQSTYPEEQLDYKNLLASCRGNEGCPPDNQHCDTSKGNTEIKYNPADYSTLERLITYSGDGYIKSTDDDFNDDVNKTLHLNLPRLRANRIAVIDTVKKVLGSKKGVRTAPEIKNHIRKWSSLRSGKKNPYCGVAIFYLQKKLH